MKWLNMIMASAISLCFTGCGGNDVNKEQGATETAKQDSAAVKPTGPPARVSGTFKGVLPCENCTETEAILTIKEDKYTYTRLFKGLKTRGNISNKSGYCAFDSGIIKLLNNNMAEDMFRIVSEDTIRALSAVGKPLKGKIDYILLRSAKQEKL
jgi:NlpE N-terminal domain